MLSYICLLLILIAFTLLSYHLFKKDILSPSFITCLCFSFSCLLSIVGIFSWNNVILENKIYWIFAIGLSAFIFGEYLIKKIYEGNKKEVKRKNLSFIDIKIQNWKVWFTIIFIIITIILLLLEIKRICIYYGFDSSNISKMLGFYRTKTLLYSTDLLEHGTDIHFIVKQMKKVMDIVCVFFMYFTIRSFMHKDSIKKTILYLTPVILSMLGTLLTSGGRSILMHMIVAFILMTLFLLLIEKKIKINKKRISLLSFIIAVVMLIFYLMLPLLGRDTDRGFLEYISFYLGTPIPSFQLFLNQTTIDLKMGAETFSSISYVLYRLGIIDNLAIGSKEWVNIGGLGSNVYTSLRVYFSDFGFIGTFILQFIFGFIISGIYNIIKNKKNTLLLIIYCYYSYILVDQIRDEQFYSLLSTATIAYLILFVAIYYIYFYLDIKKIYNKLQAKINIYKEKITKNGFWKILIKNSFWALVGDSVASVLNLIITIIIIRLIGNNDYGILVLTQSYMLILDTTFNIQCWKGVIQYGQKCLIKKNYNQLNQYIKVGIIIDLVTAIIGGIIAILLTNFIGHTLHWSNETILCAKIFSITIFSHLAGTSTAILRLFDKFHLVAFQKLITASIKLISMLILLFIIKDVNLITVSAIYCLTDIIGNILLVVFAGITYLKYNPLSNIIKANIPTDYKSFISFVLWGTMGDIVDIPVNYCDVFIISLLGNELVSVFKVFKQFIAIISKFTSAIQQAIMPQFSELNALGLKEKGYKIVIKIKNTILKLMLPLAIIVGTTSPIWLNILYGHIYAQYWYVLLLYLIVQIFALSYTTIHPFYLSLNKPKLESLYVLISNIVYLILAYNLVQHIGMIGIILSFATQCFLVIYLKIHDIKKELKI